MPLLFNDTLQASDSTGLYTLTALIGGVWTDIHTISGPQSGSIAVDDVLHTIPVDTTLLPVGQSFLFRWVDSVGNESNAVFLLVPFTILDYYTTTENITYANNSGDSWTFTVPYTPPPNASGDSLRNKIVFWSDSGSTSLIDQTAITSTQSYSFSGNGAGTYNIQVTYEGSTNVVVSDAYIMVDGAGNVLRTAIFSGFTDVTISGMNIIAAANYRLTNATVLSGVVQYISTDANLDSPTVISTTDPMVNGRIPVYSTNTSLLVYGVSLDPSEWTAGVLTSNLTGCMMSITTDIV